jgi:hypothetical protein
MRLAAFRPAIASVLALLFLAAVVPALSWRAGLGTAASDRVLASTTWLVWRGTGALSALLFVAILAAGVRELRRQAGVGVPGGRAALAGCTALAALFVGLAATV